MPTDRPGSVVTFYSYKGGVGRSFLLANVAAVLARWGYKVLCLDWDLEAPGLEQFFRPYAGGPNTGGLVELLSGRAEGANPDWRSFRIPVRFRALTRPPDVGLVPELDLIPAGRADAEYTGRLQGLSWHDLFETKDFGRYFEQLRGEWRKEYDFVLIDSRTGITDIGGVCTIHLPDLLVMVFAPNRQNLNGVIDVGRRATAKHAKLPFDRSRLLILPIPSRIESEEYKLANEWQAMIASELAEFYLPWLDREVSPADLIPFTKIPSFTYWAFGERLPVVEEPRHAADTISYFITSVAALVARRLGGTKELVENRDEYVFAIGRTQAATETKSVTAPPPKAASSHQARPRERLARSLLARLAKTGADTLKLIRQCHTNDDESRRLWTQTPELYLAFIPRLIQEGHLSQALELGQEWASQARRTPSSGRSEPFRGESRLRYFLALAAVRAGNLQYGERLLRPVLEVARQPGGQTPDMPPRLRVYAIALFARILKDRSRWVPEHCALSASAYEEAAAVPGADSFLDASTFPLVNAASMWRIAAAAEPEKGAEHLARSTALAKKVVEQIQPRIEAEVAKGDYWAPTTLGEAMILLGRQEEAVKWYLTAVKMARSQNRNGDIVAMVSNLLRLVEAGAAKRQYWVEKYIGTVVVFSGHPIDSPEWLAQGLKPRFPDSDQLATEVKEAIRVRLEKMNARVGYSSLACGSDVLFAEVMLDRNADIHIIIPFAKADFIQTNVNYDLPSDHKISNWHNRFLNIISKVHEDNIHFATTEPYLGTRSLFEFGNRFAQGLAVLHARQSSIDPKALVVLDPAAQFGGTGQFLSAWNAAGHPSEVIDLEVIRGRVTIPIAPAQPPQSCPEPEPPAAKFTRHIKAMLFADVIGFDRVRGDLMPSFLAQYARFWKSLLDSKEGRFKVYETNWRGRSFVVFDKVTDAAEFALAMLNRASRAAELGGIDWEAFGMMGEEGPVRVALHTGPTVDTSHGDGPPHFAPSVDLAEKIGPITIPGCVYATEQFAAHLTMTGSDRFRCDFVGIQDLSNVDTRCPLYSITWASPP